MWTILESIEFRSLHRKGSSLLLLLDACMGSKNGQFSEEIDCTFAIKSTIECKYSLRISHSSAHSVVKVVVMDNFISLRISLLTIPTLCCIYRAITTILCKSSQLTDISLGSAASKSPTSGDTLKHPRAITVDGGPVLYVSEWECVLFSSQGELICRVTWQQGWWTSGPCVWFN